MRKDRIDALVLGGKRWAGASDEWVAASMSFATALRDFADEVEAEPVLRDATRYSPEDIRRWAGAVEANAAENRDALLTMDFVKRIIAGLEDYSDEAG